MADESCRVYCSGPLFNDAERREMQQIADALEEAGFETFLPHRDGYEFSPLLPMLMGRGLDNARAHACWDQAIFALDAYQVLQGCDAVVVNLNGRVPDEGAVAEAAMAWARGRPVVAFKDDLRSLVSGKDNAMVVGLADFKVYSGLRNVVAQLQTIRESGEKGPHYDDEPAAVSLGRRLWEAKCGDEGWDGVADILVEHFANCD